MGSSVDNVKISPVNVRWAMEQTDTLDFTGLTNTGLAGKYFKIWAALDATKYYVWFNTGSSTDPAPAGFTEIEVNVSAASTPAQIATAAQSAIDAVSDFVATASGAIVTVKRADFGEATETLDVNSNVVYLLSRRGRDYDLGLLQGDVENVFAPSNFIVMAHQYGKTPLAAINQGFEKIEVSTTLLETQTAQLESLYKIYGGSVTPGGGTKVFGVGSASQGKNMMVEAGRLILKPVNATNDVDNLNFMLAIPVPDSLIFSGENPRTLKVTWQGFIDRDFNSKVNAIAFGDISQSGL